MSSMEVNVDVLEQMDLMDISDQEALDVFLNSGGEDNIVMSPGVGKSNDNTKVTSLSPASSSSSTASSELVRSQRTGEVLALLCGSHGTVISCSLSSCFLTLISFPNEVVLFVTTAQLAFQFLSHT